jgi:type IV pilus assembly protein PilN
MARINLLPWREELRKKKQKEFSIVVAVTVAVMAGVVFGWQWWYQELIDFQKSRNTFLTQQISALETKIKDIKDLDDQKKRLIARMEIIQQLQGSRPEIVHLIDAMVTTLPEGVFYDSIQQKGNVLSLVGIAQANAYVSSLMRKLESNEWLKDPVLKEISSRGSKGNDLIRLAAFNLEITQVSKAAKKEGEE